MKNRMSSPFKRMAQRLSMVIQAGLLLAGGVGVSALAQSATPVDGVNAAGLYARAQLWLDQNLAQSNPTLPLRMEVVVGELDRRLRLAACDQVEPFIPAGTRLWGKTRLGLRCVQGAGKWSVFVPITVKAFGPAWVIKGTVPQGAVLTEADAMQVAVDWAEQTSPVMAQQTDWVGQTALRSLSTGQTLRQDMLKPTQVFQAGAQVRVLAQGAGFAVATSAQALSAGVVGQAARVRMDNGRILSGQVLDSRTVRLVL